MYRVVGVSYGVMVTPLELIGAKSTKFDQQTPTGVSSIRNLYDLCAPTRVDRMSFQQWIATQNFTEIVQLEQCQAQGSTHASLWNLETINGPKKPSNVWRVKICAWPFSHLELWHNKVGTQVDMLGWSGSDLLYTFLEGSVVTPSILGLLSTVDNSQRLGLTWVASNYAP